MWESVMLRLRPHYECNPNIASFTGPGGFQEYKWYDNNFSTLLGTGENLVLNPAPKIIILM